MWICLVFDFGVSKSSQRVWDHDREQYVIPCSGRMSAAFHVLFGLLSGYFSHLAEVRWGGVCASSLSSNPEDR